MRTSNEYLEPVVRGAVDVENFEDGQPGLPPLIVELRRLGFSDPVQRIQAREHLYKAGPQGVIAAADFITRTDEYRPADSQLVEAIRFLGTADMEEFDNRVRESTRAALVGAMSHSSASVRVAAAGVLGRSLRPEVAGLASEIPLERIQSNNRLNQADRAGVLATVGFMTASMDGDDVNGDATIERLIEAIRFIASCDFELLEPEQAGDVRAALASALGHDDAVVRAQAAWALQVHGPGAQRTAFVSAIGDSETRVRWAVVRRFGDNPRELDKTQRSLLLTFLDSGTREEFESADNDDDGRLTPAEYPPTAPDFEDLDRDGNGEVSLDEWISPVPSEVRADVYALLLRLHGELSPDVEPTGYNPWLPSADQLDRVRLWREWNEEVSKGTNPEDEG